MKEIVDCIKPNKLEVVTSSFPQKAMAKVHHSGPDRDTMVYQLKCAVAHIRRPVLWCLAGIVLALLALGGLYALDPLNYEPPQPKFFICFFLLLLFWLAWVALVISINCLVCLKFLSHNDGGMFPIKQGKLSEIHPGVV